MEPGSLFLFGPPQLVRGSLPVHINRKIAWGVLAYIAASDHPIPRERLAAFFWPDHATDQVHAELRRTLSVIRQAVGGALEINRETVFLPPDAPLQVDVRQFEDLVKTWRDHRHRQTYTCEACFSALKTASVIYRDHFMAGFTLADGGEFTTWQTLQEQALRNLLGGALEWLARYHAAQGAMESATACARRWLALDPLNEPAHILLMQLYARNGQRAAAVRQFEECEKVLLAELGLPPQAETIQAYRSIVDQQEQPPVDQRAPAVPETGGLPVHNLPFQSIPFIGRERFMADIDQHLRNPACRLLTFTGPGGSGKSRLAIEAARQHLNAFPDGAYFVRLAECASDAEIVPMIAKVLGFQFYPFKETGRQSEGAQNVPAKQQLLGYLHNKTMLLILDNFEHLRGSAGLLIELLEAAPHLLLLVTSRIRLDILHEYVIPISGLDLPEGFLPPIAFERVEEFAKFGGVRFFVQCAQMTTPTFQLRRDNLAQVLHICQALRGMPLGILLAAAWLPVLDLKEICAEIDQNFNFLETGFYGLPERQRSMRAVFNHTWRLLSSQEQAILQGLSVFHAGFSRQAASFVTGAALPDLKSLASKWLVERDQQGRFVLHELLRQYLGEKLEERPAAKTKANDAHLQFFANFLQERSAGLEGNDFKQALAEIGAEIENIRAAWGWALERQNFQAVEQLLEGLAKFYELSARYQEGESAFAQAANLLTGIRDTQEWAVKNDLPLGKILVRLGSFYGMQGLAYQTRETLQRGLGLLQASGDRKELGYGFLYLGAWQPSIEERRKYLDKALAIFTEINERKGTARVQKELGYIELNQGNFQKARQFFYASLEMHRQLENQRDTASSLGDIAYIHWIMGNYPVALQSLTECLEILEECNDKMGLAFTYSLFGTIYGALKDYARAKEFVWKRFAISKEAGNNIGCAFSLMSIAECELMEGNPEKANHLVKQSYPYYEKIGDHFPEEGWYYRVLGEAECGLGNLEEGRRHLRRALFVLTADNRLVQNTHTMIGIARYFDQMGQKERAFELLGLALHHPGSWQWVRDRAAALVEKLKQEYPPEMASAALERGRTLDLANTVTALLAELEEEHNVLKASI